MMKERIIEKRTSSAIYGLGFIGAAIYYTSSASSFMVGAIGFLKALVWPAFLVYELLSFIHGAPSQ